MLALFCGLLICAFSCEQPKYKYISHTKILDYKKIQCEYTIDKLFGVPFFGKFVAGGLITLEEAINYVDEIIETFADDNDIKFNIDIGLFGVKILRRSDMYFVRFHPFYNVIIPDTIKDEKWSVYLLNEKHMMMKEYSSYRLLAHKITIMGVTIRGYTKNINEIDTKKGRIFIEKYEGGWIIENVLDFWGSGDSHFDDSFSFRFVDKFGDAGHGLFSFDVYNNLDLHFKTLLIWN